MIDLAGKHIHCIGIGGIGVSALARIALARGARITGSDLHENDQTLRLRTLGATVHIGHAAGHVGSPDLAVYSSAVRADNPERLAAERVCPTLRRGAFLAELMRGCRGVGICGTHGKSTTSSIIAQLLDAAGRAPTVCLGAVPAGREDNAWCGTSDLFVAELDESDASFLEPQLSIAVVTNIEADHLDHYGTFDAIRSAFTRFAAQLPPDGTLVACSDDPAARELLGTHPGPSLRTGLDPEAELTVDSLGMDGMIQVFRLRLRHADLGTFRLALPGTHNLRNALCALGACLSLGVDADALRAALPRCVPVTRRFETVGRANGITCIDDYAHHPTEIAATLATARACHPGRVVAVFQPHLYSRTQFLAEGFARSLALADVVVLADIYPAREAPIPGVTSELIARELPAHGASALGPFPREGLASRLAPVLRRGDLVCFIGAGDIGACAREYLDTMQG